MADSFTGNINLRKPEVGGSHDSWGGVAGLNGDLDILDAIFLHTGLSTVAPPAGHPLAGVPGVGLRIGVGMVANVEGTLLVADSTDTTAAFKLDASDITTATIRTLKAPDASGTIALTSDPAFAHTGDIKQGIWAAAPVGWVLADGRTIGSATSGASSRAHADCEALFSLLWTQFPAALIYTFEGVASTRGANAAADFAANKRLTMFDARGAVLAGLDNMGGTARGVLTTTVTPNGNTIGASGGAQTHTLTIHELAAHAHADSGHTHANENGWSFAVRDSGYGQVNVGSGGGVSVGYTNSTGVGTAAIGNNGGGGAHNNVQPTVVVNIAVKL